MASIIPSTPLFIVTSALNPKEISDLIMHVLSSKATYKTIKLFPDSEWHQ